jgi:hypothetical protein
MDFFQKKDNKTSENTNKDEWIIAEGQHEGKRLIVRLNVGAEHIANDKRYPFRIGIAIPFKSPSADGMPKEDELLLFGRIEDMIVDRFSVDQVGILCVAITTHGMRELVIYSKTNDVKQMMEDICTHFPEYDFQHYAKQDRKWDEFNYWNERLGA